MNSDIPSKTAAPRKCRGCGARLRSTNPDPSCAACTAAGSQHRASAIPARFWESPDVQAALVRRDLPGVVRLINRKLGWSQVALAAATGYSQAHMSRWINGNGKSDGITLGRLVDFAKGLGIPLRLIGLAEIDGGSPQS